MTFGWCRKGGAPQCPPSRPCSGALVSWPDISLQDSTNDLGLFFCLRKSLVFTSVSLLPWLVPQVHGNIIVLSLENFPQCHSPAKDNLISPDSVLF